MDFLLQCISLFYKGGPVMYVIAGCSLAVVAIAVERFIYFRQMSTDAQVFINKLQPLLERKKITEAQQLCEHTPAVIGRLAAEGLEAYQKESNLEVIMEGTAALSAARLREYLNYLSSIVTLSPLLGLLGTVIGMINSFSVFNVKNGQPMAITGGIGEALVATATGLMVAIMALVVHTYFTHRLDQLVTDMEQVYTLIMTRLAGNKKTRRENHEIA
ncbi:MotA/TolQ/ExbB proton channel family protein [Pelosinus fermentans]|jgi:biopolymer transport protein ExbB|uniref:MotA/TolQ/ExbB proton channel family protein n=1 Tax=Pelosinus fermentans TaxID=365349 RepID=UPI0002684F2B|nr:MotA/TolQ/ExbB proton channel family protein [Pelosinus fermentans]EIW21699.1 MotA/TolQ/ExbB proton channel [Pelosinus fermentans A11]